jgi:hypothetical protein
MYHQFNIQEFYVLPTQCIYVFCVDLRTNSNNALRRQSFAAVHKKFTDRFHIVNPSVTVTRGERLDARVTDVVALRVCPYVTRVRPVTLP